MRLGFIDLNKTIQILLRGTHQINSSTLRPIMRQHQNLREVCKILNDAYGTPIFLATSFVLFEVTYSIFYFCDTMQTFNSVENIFFFIWSLLHTVVVVVVMRLCQRAKSEVKSSGIFWIWITLYVLNITPCTHNQFDTCISTIEKTNNFQRKSIKY